MLGNGQIHTSRVREAEILLSSSKHSDKSEIYSLLTNFLGCGLLISNRQKWQTRRKLLTPAFHFNILQQFSAIFHEESSKCVHKIRDKVRTGEDVLDVAKLCSRLTLDVICETAMGVKLDRARNADEYRKNLYKAIEFVIYRVMRPWLYDDFVFKLFGYQRQMDRHVKVTKAFTRDIIQRQRKLFHGSSKKLAVKEWENENM